MAVTIRDVAALAGVSPSTVSRTCKDHRSISEETKIRVRRAMDQLGYEYSAPQEASNNQTSRTIGIILPPSTRQTYENPFYLEAIRGISQFCNGHKYISTIITGQNSEEVMEAIQTMVSGNHVDGFIVLYSKEDDAIVDYLYSEGFTYVLIGKAKQFANQTIYIDNDNILAGKEATEYLISLGHKKIAYLGSESIKLFSADRKTGYQLSMLQHDLVAEKKYVVAFPIEDAPAVTPSTGQYDDYQQIKVVVPEGYSAYYTVDGTDPTTSESRILYSGPIDMPEGNTILSVVLMDQRERYSDVTKRNYELIIEE